MAPCVWQCETNRKSMLGNRGNYQLGSGQFNTRNQPWVSASDSCVPKFNDELDFNDQLYGIEDLT